MYLLCCTNEAVVKKILKNDALVTKKKRKKCRSFVRQCWYILTSWIFNLFKLNFLHMIKRYRMSALSEINSQKNNIHCCMTLHTCHHTNSYYNSRSICVTCFHLSSWHISSEILLLLEIYHQLQQYFIKPLSFRPIRDRCFMTS